MLHHENWKITKWWKYELRQNLWYDTPIPICSISSSVSDIPPPLAYFPPPTPAPFLASSFLDLVRSLLMYLQLMHCYWPMYESGGIFFHKLLGQVREYVAYFLRIMGDDMLFTCSGNTINYGKSNGGQASCFCIFSPPGILDSWVWFEWIDELDGVFLFFWSRKRKKSLFIEPLRQPWRSKTSCRTREGPSAINSNRFWKESPPPPPTKCYRAVQKLWWNFVDVHTRRSVFIG